MYNLDTKSDLWWKCWHYIMGFIIRLGPIFFLFALVSNLAYIEYRLCQIWSIYMQYLRCYDHSNKCLFLVIQQAEVLLNFFWWVYMPFWFERVLVGDEDLVVWTATSAIMNRSTASEILKWIINPLCATTFIDVLFEIYQNFIKMKKMFDIWYEQFSENV